MSLRQASFRAGRVLRANPAAVKSAPMFSLTRASCECVALCLLTESVALRSRTPSSGRRWGSRQRWPGALWLWQSRRAGHFLSRPTRPASRTVRPEASWPATKRAMQSSSEFRHPSPEAVALRLSSVGRGTPNCAFPWFPVPFLLLLLLSSPAGCTASGWQTRFRRWSTRSRLRRVSWL